MLKLPASPPEIHLEVPVTGWFLRSHRGCDPMVRTVTQITRIEGVLCRIVVELEHCHTPSVFAAWIELPTLEEPSAPVEFRYASPLDPCHVVLHPTHVPGTPE